MINWGNSAWPQSWRGRSINKVFNDPSKVLVATDKLASLRRLSEAGVSIPKYATTRQAATELFQDNGIVVCRTVLNGHSGRGIVIAREAEELVDAPLYTRHVRHKDEYRVHVVGGKVIDYVAKKKRAGEESNILVRSYDNGWVFCREGVVLPDTVRDQSLSAIAALGLDFGAVDVGHRVGDGVAVVFEVNTAPGLEGTTIERYRDAILEEIAD